MPWRETVHKRGFLKTRTVLEVPNFHTVAVTVFMWRYFLHRSVPAVPNLHAMLLAVYIGVSLHLSPHLWYSTSVP